MAAIWPFRRRLIITGMGHQARDGRKKEVACGGWKMAAKCTPLPVGPAAGLLATLLPERFLNSGEVLLVPYPIGMMREKFCLRPGNSPIVICFRFIEFALVFSKAAEVV